MRSALRKSIKLLNFLPKKPAKGLTLRRGGGWFEESKADDFLVAVVPDPVCRMTAIE